MSSLKYIFIAALYVFWMSQYDHYGMCIDVNPMLHAVQYVDDFMLCDEEVYKRADRRKRYGR